MTGATLGTYYTRCRATFHWERDYDVFALLANVRNDNRYVSISEPRGWPSVEWFGGHDPWEMEDHGDSDGCHSASWVSTDELVGAQKFYTSIGDGNPSQDMMHAITMMRGYEHAYPNTEVRLVFCFDD